MTNKRNELIQELTKAQYEPSVQQVPELLKLTKDSLDSLKADDSDDFYLGVITEMSRQISAYYIKHEGVPVPIAAVYTLVKDDVPATNVDEKALRRENIARGITSIPITFH